MPRVHWPGLLLLVAIAVHPAIGDDEVAVRIVDAVGPAVASVVAEPRRGDARHVGSAVVVDPAGFLLTNAHVVAGAGRIVVALPGRQPLEGNLLATAPEDDLALLRVRAGAPLPAARLATEEVKVGQSCLAIGNALGLDATVTRGIISARGRRLVHEGRQLGVDFLQTDAAIHPGSSGGPLVDLSGAVIGITTAVEQDAPGVGFAIPAARARRVLAALSSPLLLRERWLGLEVEDAPGAAGARVVAVEPGGPAEAAGLRTGDVIISAGPVEVSSAFHLHARFLGDDASAVRLAVIGIDGVRRGARLSAAAPPWTAGLRRRLGLTVRRDGPGSGLVVVAVDADSPGAAIGLQPGDRIVRVGPEAARATLDGPRALWGALRQLETGAPLGITIVRDGREYWGEMRIR
jgi:serine protease Do